MTRGPRIGGRPQGPPAPAGPPPSPDGEEPAAPPAATKPGVLEPAAKPDGRAARKAAKKAAKGDAAGRRAPRRRRARLPIALAAAAVVAAGGVAAFIALDGAGSSGEAAATGLPPSTTKVTEQTLKDTETVDGELGYGPTYTATSGVKGTLTALPESGSEIKRGHELYEVDSAPVVLMYGSKPAYRPLTVGTEGSDVKRFEENLGALGYDGFTVDDEYSSSTAEAVREWQDDIGVEETGIVEPGRVVFAHGAVRVDSLQASVGGRVGPGTKVLDYTGTAKAVTVELETSEQRMAKKGAAVEVTLPENETVKAEIDEVTTVIDPGGQGEEPTTKVEVTVWLDSGEAAKAAADYALASVDVTFTAGQRENVLTVPVTALVALTEGGFGVEVVKDGTSSFVPVETGLFAGGKVEISGPGITAGTVVGTPE
ncbi:peptidoglycan-binding protein [Actinomadura algeriensis]|uniref:Peptidoglycan hydrolase-like protein with peptidoglycan-binding domain n=1 Tax=Actinomadura algeriensis TaxID=1679523 RepID=A0ABR9JK27_9ACTN|nr:peptidoglycan-binding protein [Actinomadura algeriensis]MBE1530907.1 peptidoglycan hydrolase-like protein with peptidoglycan-binding domain [Actinomadura algeriensis]